MTLSDQSDTKAAYWVWAPGKGARHLWAESIDAALTAYARTLQLGHGARVYAAAVEDVGVRRVQAEMIP